MGFVLVINTDQMGHGDRELGHRLLGTCLRKLASADDLETIILYNAGVLLAVKESYAAVELRLLHERGAEVLVCGTCVDHFGIRDRLMVDRVSNMDEILATLRAAGKVITL
jgi:intracellular sulfur oxidation DsrE/DsrF family protein